MMTVYSQTDPRWAWKPLKPSTRNIGQIGCTITCLAMLSTYYGEPMNPAQMADYLKFTPDGKVYWTSVNFNKWKFSWRGYTDDRKAILKAVLGKPETSVIIEVNKAHWLVVTGKAGNALFVADPLKGTRKINLRRITGYAIFIKK